MNGHTSLSGAALLRERIRRRLATVPAAASPELRRFHLVANVAYPVGLLWHTAFIFIFWAVGATLLAVLNVASVAVWAIAIRLQIQGRIVGSLAAVLLEVLAHAIACVVVIGWAAGFQYYVLTLAATAFFTPTRLALKILPAALAAAVYLLLGLGYADATPPVALDAWVLDVLYYSNAASAFFVISVSSFAFDRAATVAEATLVAERTRSDELASVLQTMFGRYLAPEVMRSMIANPAALELGGQKRCVTILMADLRGFTALAERLAPEQVVRLLNSYLGVMVEVIVRHQGTVNEIIGDALMVLFGAPQEMPDRAERAVACAIEMQNAMSRVNARNRADGLPELQMGIGLNDAEVVVGNIGTERRSKYAAVGSGVNLASRIESYSVGGEVLVSESVRAALGDALRIDGQREILPKGTEAPLRIYQVGGIAGRYNVALEEAPSDWATPAARVPLRYALLAGKASAAAPHETVLARLSKTCAEIVPRGELSAMSDLRMNLIDVDGALAQREFYGKIVRAPAAPGEPAVVRFTSLPPEVDAYFQALRRCARTPEQP